VRVEAVHAVNLGEIQREQGGILGGNGMIAGVCGEGGSGPLSSMTLVRGYEEENACEKM
jgi:hypothetical protein